MCPDTNSPEDSGKAYDGKKNHSQHFTDKDHDTGVPDLHVCPLNRKCRAQCLAWRTGSLPLALRWFAEYHDWHESGYLANQLKILLVFKKPVRAAANKLLAVGLDGLAAQIKKEFKRLLEMCQPLDGVRGRLIVEEDEAMKLEHTRAYLTESLVELAGLVESGVQNRECRVKNEETTQQTPENSNQWLTNIEAGEILGIHRSTVSKWANKGRFSDNGIKGQKRRLSKASVLLVKREIEDNDARKDDDDVRDDRRRFR